jgi:predicted adenylyl cyclase CyaB
MPANIEIKARATDFSRQLKLAESLADGPGLWIDQEDVFFNVRQGRLKLRIFAPDRGELISYQRPDGTGPKLSRYRIVAIPDPGALRGVLAAALGELGIVRKRRFLALRGATRIHLDEVEGLGRFIELEIVLEKEAEAGRAEAAAQHWMRQLGIEKEDLVAGAYFDLLASGPDG